MAKPARKKSLRRVRTTRGSNFITLEEAERSVHKKPDDAEAWRRLGVIQMRKGRLRDAIASLEKSEQLNPEEHNTFAWLGYTHTQLGNMEQAEEYLNRVLEENPQHLQALIGLVALQFHSGKNKLALETLETAEALSPDNRELLEYKGQALMKHGRYEEALDVYHRIIEHNPDNMMAWNAAGVVYRDIGDFDKLVQYHKKAMSLNNKSPLPFSNLLTAVHYSPDWSNDEIAELCKEWQERYAPCHPPARPVPGNLSPTKRLRIGMFSDGFRSHPVGNMIIEAVERLHSEEVEIYCYPTHSDEDHITRRFKKVAAKWQLIKHLTSNTFAQSVRDDGIDILIDMSGHNSGSRAYAVALQPAPLLVKWVGGLINTTGIEAMDYLLSDSIETPPDEKVDQHYGEKLVRLPDDYIVYHIPHNIPPVRHLPASKNGFITLGCFNNPTKLNDVTLKEWAKLMHELPDSRLFLKSKPYTSEALCERIYATLEHEGIARERVMIEGPAQHLKLLEAYGKVDIALDPWPYSGGLTTCESLLMGVPVVSLPGPTFAGRHSATHLVNAGLPELVVDSWEQYRERVIELASDLNSLSTIRTHLRDILKQSPVCDGARFAKHLMITLRAIWQRYCEGKAPEALTFNKDGQAWFKGESEPLDIVVQEVKSTQQKDGFNWEIQGQVVTIDNACKVLRDRALSLMIKSRAFAIIAFDPQSLVQKPEVYENSQNIQLFQHALLGDGQPATLHACMAPTLSSTLKPLPAEQQPLGKRDGTRLLTTLPINTIALDSIEGISLDWLVLDGLSDAATILEHGKKALTNTLLIEVSAVFQPTHERQPNLAELQHWASRHGFRFYCLNAPSYISHLPERVSTEKRQATELESADAIFIPSHDRMANLSDNECTKLAFLMHTVYGIKDMAYELLAKVSQEKAEEYLAKEGLATIEEKKSSTDPRMLTSEHFKNDQGVDDDISSGQQLTSHNIDSFFNFYEEVDGKFFVHICFNNMHTQSLIEASEAISLDGSESNVFLVSKAKSVKGFSVASDKKEVFYFDASRDLLDVVSFCKNKSVQGVYVHGLFFDWQKFIVNEVGSFKKLAWVIWGGDIYRYSSSSDEMVKLVDKVACIATVTRDDYKVYKRLFGEKTHFDFAYRFPFDELDKNLPVVKQKMIVVGNSGDVSNNHVEIFDALSTKEDIHSYNIVVPCSYNASPEYASKIYEYALSKGFSKNRVKILTDFLSKDDYFEIIGRAELLVTAHDRSQAGATINAAIYFGTKVVLKKHICYREALMKNPMWNRLSDMSIQCIEFLDLINSKSLKQLPSKDNVMVEKDRANLRKARGDEALGNNLALINSFLKV